MGSPAFTQTVLLAAVLVAAAPVRGQEAPVLRLSLDEAVARALATSHRLAEARARETAALAGVAAREADRFPTVSASAGYTRTNHVIEFTVPGPTGVPRVLYPDVPNNYSLRLDLRWPIYTGGRTDALERAARAEAGAVASEVRQAQSDLRLEVARAYWAVVTAAAAADVLQRGVARSQAHVAEVTQRFEAGLIPPNEIAAATAQEARSRMLAIEADTQRDVARAELARLVGVDPGQAIEPTADLGPDDAALDVPPADPAPLVTAALGVREDRRALEYRLEASRAQRDAAAAGRKPTVSLGGGIDHARPNPRIFPREDVWQRSWDAGVGASITLWDGGRVGAEIGRAAAQTEAVSQRLADYDEGLAVEIRQRLRELESGRAAVAAASSAVTAAREARRVVDERYRAGVIAEIEVLDAEFALLQAELDRTRAQAGVRLSDARLSRALGR